MNNPLVFLTAVLGLGITAQWLAWRLKLPSILLLLAFGFMVGVFSGDNPDVPGDTITDEMLGSKLLFPIVSLSVAVIMFEGGLTLRFHEIHESAKTVLRLVTVGALVTWVLAAGSAKFILGMENGIAALTGAILVVTGPTVIGPLLRHVRPSRKVGSIVKWEGIVIDPIGAVLAVLVFDAIIEGDPQRAAIALAKILAIGAFLGLSLAYAMVQVLRRYWIPDFLHNPVFLAVALAAFTVSNLMAPEAGLVTVTVLGIALANQKTVAVRHVVEFKENLRVLLISCLFIVLAARIRPSDILNIGWQGLVFLAVLILLVRPIAVFASTFGSKLTKNERWFLAFLAPRGIVAAAVSSVFALEVAAHSHDGEIVPGADMIVPVTFLVIVGTVAIYGLAASPLAKRLGLAVANPQGILFAGATPWVRALAKAVHDEGIPVLLVDTNYQNIAAARMEGLAGRCASIVSDHMEDIDLGGLGRLMAATPNHDLNTLAAMEFAPVFGRAKVYQLPPGELRGRRREATPSHLRGRYLFANDANYDSLELRFATGSIIKKSKITDSYTYEDFLARYGEDVQILFVLTESKQLNIITAGEKIAPKSGQVLFSLVRESDSHK
ncbi:MAG: sodium:proton antiporter [Planctomycetales bacterium]|nr:sodium:proton antiporter [Planctomycetales bacterium]